MKAYRVLTMSIALTIWIAISSVLFAQEFDIPRPSPKASISQHIGVSEIVVTYCRPSVKGREIFGNKVPYGEVWRTGANEATTISFPHDVRINGQELSAGKYSFFTIPTKDKWTVIFNKEWNQWGAYHYHQDQDVLRVEVVSTPNDLTEQLTISFSGVTKNKGVFNLHWEESAISFEIETDTYTNTLSAIEKVKTELGANWYVYSAAAQYHFYELKNTAEAIELINVAIALDAPNPAPWMLKSQILAYEKKYDEAIEQAELALEACEKHNFPFEIHENEEQIKKWKSLRNK